VVSSLRHFVSRNVRQALIAGGACSAMASHTYAGVPTPTILLEAVPATAVPALTPLILVLTCVMLIIVGMRNPRMKPAWRNTLGSCVLFSGVGLSAFYFYETNAAPSGEKFTLDGAQCDESPIKVEVVSNASLKGPNPVNDLTDNRILNSCDVDYKIVEYRLGCTTDGFNDNGSPEGTLIKAGEERVIGFCFEPEQPVFQINPPKVG